MAITRIVARWTGFTGAPGYSNFFFGFEDSAPLLEEARAQVVSFFDEMSGILPSAVSIAVQDEYAIIDEQTGTLIGYADGPAAGNPVQGNGGQQYAAPVGAVINWNTQTVARGRRLRGRTFIVPLAAGQYEDDGTLQGTALIRLRAAADIMAGDPFSTSFGIWSRPINGAGGSFGEVTSSTVPDLAAVLRSRRD